METGKNLDGALQNIEEVTGAPLAVTILAHMENREIVRVGNTLAVGKTTSKLVLLFPQTNKNFPPKAFIVEVPDDVMVEYAECTYDLQREAHPELNLPDRSDRTFPTFPTP
jgi:hypothetical protein